MAVYDLDEKKGLFSKLSAVNPTKVMIEGDKIRFKHFNMFENVDFSLTRIHDSSLRIQAEDAFDIMQIMEGDHVVLDYSSLKDRYIISGEITAIDAYPPYKVDVRIENIENIKELRKFKRYYVSNIAYLKVPGETESKQCVLKNISFGGVKINCKEDLKLKDFIDVIIVTDKKQSKFSYRGKIIRKSILTNVFEYGIERSEITETNGIAYHKFVNRYEFD